MDAMWRRIILILFLGYSVIWTALLLVPDVTQILFLPSELPQEITKSNLPVDKVAHATGYFVLTGLALAALGRSPRGFAPGWLGLGAALHGAATEVAQIFIPLRSAELLDWCADATGVVLALSLVLTLRSLAAPRLLGQVAGTEG